MRREPGFQSTGPWTVYDAAYLELAQRTRLPLATLDSELREAARTEGVALLGMA
jgi:predicted nucleic acid-binding protein